MSDWNMKINGAALGMILGLTGMVPGCFAQDSKLPGDFVYLRDIDPSIIQDVRYATANNFVGHRLNGYEAGECIVTRSVGNALARVQRDLAARGLSLKMFDCYRPQRAVDDMYAWAQDGREVKAQQLYNPKLRKRDLFKLGYIARHSGHSTGKAVDLTIVQLPEPKVSPFDSKADYADCTAPAAHRAPESGVDTGTGLRLLGREGTYRLEGDHAGSAQMARYAGLRDGKTRFRQLRHGMVAFLTAGAG